MYQIFTFSFLANMKFAKFYIQVKHWWRNAGKKKQSLQKKKTLGKSKTLCNRREILLEYLEFKRFALFKNISSLFFLSPRLKSCLILAYDGFKRFRT